MYYKIALKNVRKSFKDYSIYFLTLTLAVCVFYSFNSIGSQKALMELESSGASVVSELMDIIGYLSVFVSAILGSLILYANNFLIKKRKKELGIYMVLGMGKRKISSVLLAETVIVGAISLAMGLLLGIGVSQGLSVFTSKLFEVSMEDYAFVISTGAMGKTALYFGIIFLLVALFNTATVSKYKVIDLLTAGRKNEDMHFRNPAVYAISLALSLVSFGVAYSFIWEVGLNATDLRFVASIVLGVVGTALFFFGLSSTVLYIVKRKSSIYFKSLNMFTVKQLNSKINTNFLSMSIICLMLFLTMSVLSTGISFKEAIESGLEDTTPFDASVSRYESEEGLKSLEESLEDAGFDLAKAESYKSFDLYDSGHSLGSVISSGGEHGAGDDFSRWADSNLDIMKLSDYNDIRKLEGKGYIDLEPEEVLLIGNAEFIVPHIEEYLSKNKRINLGDRRYIVKGQKFYVENIYNDFIKTTFPIAVVEDSLVEGLRAKESHININYSEEQGDESEKELRGVLRGYKDGETDYSETGFLLGGTREEIYESSKSMTTTVLFVGIYIGIVFLITSMAVLALQQLSEASDSIERYKSLKKIGASEEMVNKTILAQTASYFTLPLALAVVHSYVGIKIANKVIETFNKPSIGTSSLVTAAVFILIYSGYFLATYSGYKEIVKSNT